MSPYHIALATLPMLATFTTHLRFFSVSLLYIIKKVNCYYFLQTNCVFKNVGHHSRTDFSVLERSPLNAALAESKCHGVNHQGKIENFLLFVSLLMHDRRWLEKSSNLYPSLYPLCLHLVPPLLHSLFFIPFIYSLFLHRSAISVLHISIVLVQ
jgi:hypothetical protein